MTADPHGPADTRMMGVVHDALRRDLTRARRTLAADPPPGAGRRKAVAEHLRWVTRFLHDHHCAEDAALWPVVLARNPAAAPLMARMAAQHEQILPAVAALEQAAETCLSGADDDGGGLLAAVAGLEEVLLPHLQQEEDEAMPVVASTLTHQQWSDLEQRHNIQRKSVVQLADEGHFLLDGLDADRRRLVTDLVPAVPRFILLHGFGWRYRRRSRRRWGRPELLRRADAVAVEVAAPPAAVWEVVSDITRIGEWSHECAGGRWLGDARAAAPGVRFRGRNRNGLIRWSRTCELVTVDAPRELVWRTVPGLLYPDSTTWSVSLLPAGGGTRIEQRYEVTTLPPEPLERLYARVLPAHRDRTAALSADLRRLGSVAAARSSDHGAPAPRMPDADEPVPRSGRRAGLTS
jgi:hemerythrin-like domain-containing protein